MKTELKQKWVNALRSGEYKQGKNYLRRKNSSGDTYCCLGVLFDVWKGDWEEITNCYAAKNIDGTASTATLVRLLTKIDLSDITHNTLISMNDNGKSFHEIANWIEGHI